MIKSKKLFSGLLILPSIIGNAYAATIYEDNINSFSLGGRVEPRAVINTNDGSSVDDQSRARINVSGQSKISDDLSGIGFTEIEFKPSSDFNVRHLYAGLNSKQWGTLVYGKTYGSLTAITDFTDVMAYHGGEAVNKVEAGDRVNNQLVYWNQVGSFDFRLNYHFADDALDDSNPYHENKNGFSTSGIYSTSFGLDLGAAFALQQNDSRDATNAIYAVRYSNHNFYIGLLYSNGDLSFDDGTYDSYEGAIQYTIGKLLLGASYTKGSNSYRTFKEDYSDNYVLDATYNFTGNFIVYGSYLFEQLKDKDDEIAIGMKYSF
ncbi:porin [Photobacterium damselae]|uniref:porin n=1 Tax=Photobacterium damselae TaxID=38293 RepID=UPI000D662B8C|nr:porin [Photobacterium damselae]AWK84049.1 hypothetical protein BST98_18875 [Photobacterium damselae]